ncbi:hypothetical protein [Microbacterium sp. NPDC058345]|uniref:hypothetical protein n=1 Tax=Microbacterium sp. NPDC058345 TaxID=3346455 RepID=UPI003657DA61
MTITLARRALSRSPLPLITASEGRMLGIRLPSSRHVRVRAGVYADRAGYAALPAWKRYAVRVHAFLRTHPDAVLCMESAAVALGIPYFNEPKDIHVYDAGRAASRRYGDVVVHTSADPREVGSTAGILTTSPLDTAVDLVRVLPPAQGLAVADAAISAAQRGFTDLATLCERADAQQNTRGRARLRWAWDHADGRAESPGESVSRSIIGWCGFETPELQQRFDYEGYDDRVDFLFPSRAVIGESDGWDKYALGDPKEAAKNLADEKRREDRLRRHGHPFARWDLTDAWRVAPLARALQSAGVPLRHPRRPAMLATIRHRPREKPLRS